MSSLIRLISAIAGLAAAIGIGSVALAQTVTGTLGSPNATTTIPPTQSPRKDAPNVLLISTGDVRYSVFSTFGGVIPTPTMDRVAKQPLPIQLVSPFPGVLT